MHPRDDLSEYAAGSLPPDQVARVAAHLRSCRECSAEASAWAALTAPGDMPGPGVLLAALRPAPPDRLRWRLPLALLRAQLRLVPLPVWLLAMAATLLVTLLTSHHPALLALMLPIAPALGVAAVAERDPAPVGDVVRAAATSPRTVLVCRILLVLALNAAVVLAVPGVVGTWHGWLGAAAVLPAVALFASVPGGRGVAGAVAAIVWALRPIAEQAGWPLVRAALRSLWEAGPVSASVAAALTVAAVLASGRGEPGRRRGTTSPV